jgi:sugar lactone lactonase YvrE
MKGTGKAQQILYVFGLALVGLTFYVAMALLVVVGALALFSGRAHAAAETSPPAIDAGYTGNWFDPMQSGQGLMVEVLPGNQMLVMWFSFDPDGAQAWFGGVGTYVGNVATITDVAQPVGGRWVPDFDPAAVVRKPWGTLTLTFSDRDHGHVDFTSTAGFGTGGMDLMRLTNVAPRAGDAVPIGSPVAVTTDAAGNVYFSSEPASVYKLDNQGRLARVAGTGTPGFSGDGGPATSAQLDFPWIKYPEYLADPIDYSPMIAGLAVDASGNLLIADAYNNRVRRVDANGIITTVAGDGRRLNAGDGGSAKQAAVYWPQGVGVDTAGNVLVTSAWGPLRRIDSNGTITTLATNNCGANYRGAGFCVPENFAIDANRNVYVTDGYCRVRKMNEDIGSAITIAGDDDRPSNGSAFTCGYYGDGGPAINAALNYPYAVALGVNGMLYVADTYNDCVRRFDPAGIITTFAGRCLLGGFGGDGGAATDARLRKPFGVAVDLAGNVYIADTGNKRIRKVTSDGTISTVAGNGAELIAGAVDPGYTGSWYNTAQSGHGLMLEVLSENRMLAFWFAFDPSGQHQAWFGGLGTYVDNRVTIDDVIQPTGARWLPNYDEASVAYNRWGTLKFTFSDCNHGVVAYDSPTYGAGSIDITRLTLPAGLTCQ